MKFLGKMMGRNGRLLVVILLIIFLSQVDLFSLNIVRNIVPDLKNVPFKVKDLIPKEKIESIRLRHIQVETENMAKECYRMLMSGTNSFDELAKMVSQCQFSKENGGEIGWLSAKEQFGLELNPSYAELALHGLGLTKGEISVLALNSSKPKPTWHVLQVLDIITKLTPKLLSRKKETYFLTKSLDSDKVPKYFIETLGCQMNVADSERIAAQLSQLGLVATQNKAEANTIVINTCSIREHAEKKLYSMVGEYAKRKRTGEDVAIIIAGCVAQQEGENLIKRCPEIDAVIGPQFANRFADLLQAVADGYRVVATDPAHQNEDDLPPLRSNEFSAFVNVIYGCNERCTYCVVPNTRGIEQSRTIESIVAEIHQLAESGYKEVTLLGQNIDAWGRDFTPKQKFADLLSVVGKIEGIDRIRFITSHPKYMSERVIRAVADNPRIMPCFHIPFQSGDNEILAMMRRGYTREKFLHIVKNIRTILPDAAITADCIVGFPGETEEQYENTLKLLEEVKFETVYSAAYSPRPATPAATWTNQIPDDVKQSRLKRLNELLKIHALERTERFVGRVQPVLVENVNLKNPAQVLGRNPHSRLVCFDGDYKKLRGKIVNVKMLTAKPYYLLGELHEEQSTTAAD